MAFADDQLALLTTARDALHGWQATAQGVDVTLQQVVMLLPTDNGERRVTFTWNDQAERFDISS